MSNLEAAGAAAVAPGYVLKPPVHRALARVGLAPDPDPVAHDVRTIAFLEALDLDPVDALGQESVDQASAWSPDATWVPFPDRVRERLASASRRPIGSPSRLSTT